MYEFLFHVGLTENVRLLKLQDMRLRLNEDRKVTFVKSDQFFYIFTIMQQCLECNKFKFLIYTSTFTKYTSIVSLAVKFHHPIPNIKLISSKQNVILFYLARKMTLAFQYVSKTLVFRAV